MCGIVGFIGNENKANDFIIKGLKKLEYRGYDSSGLAIGINNELQVYKACGRISELEKLITNVKVGNIGIGHTRWATHGKPTTINSHPHQSMNKVITVVHNGVIENFIQLKNFLLDQEYSFVSDTDTEVIANLIEYYYSKGNSIDKVLQILINELHGSYALGIIVKDNLDSIYCVKNKAPMLAGIGQGFNMIGSDMSAMIEYTDRFYEIHDEEYLIINKDDITIYDKLGYSLQRDVFISKLNIEDVSLGNYDCFMHKEIDDQPVVLRTLMNQYFDFDGNTVIDQTVIDLLNDSDRIYIIASGTSYNAGLIGQTFFRRFANKPCETYIGSEFGYELPCLSTNPIFLFISQSGETADSRVSLQKVKELGYKSITITNVLSSTLSRESDATVLLHAGPELAVASTKAYTAQCALLAIIANKMSQKPIDMRYELSLVAHAIENLLQKKEVIKKIVQDKIITSRNCFYIGKLLDYATALEAALKLKEVSYIQTEGFAAAELKHGTIALIEDGTPVIGIITQKDVALNTRSSLEEVKARNANCIVISMASLSRAGDDFVIDDTNENLSPIVSVVVTQLISYYAGLLKGLDVDKPRNLAKSVTVE